MGKKKKSNYLPIGPSVIELFFVSIYLPLSKSFSVIITQIIRQWVLTMQINGISLKLD